MSHLLLQTGFNLSCLSVIIEREIDSECILRSRDTASAKPDPQVPFSHGSFFSSLRDIKQQKWYDVATFCATFLAESNAHCFF